MKKSDLPECPIELALDYIGNKWRMIIIRELMKGTRRFGELRKSVTGISQKVLTENLRDMEEKGLVSRKVYPEVPPKVEYTLTELGYSTKSVLEEMKSFGNILKNFKN